MEFNNKNLLKNVILNFLYKPLSIALSLIYTPLVINYLGDEKYGVWATLLSILSWINYFDIGIGNGLRNKLTEELSIDKKNEAVKSVSTAYIAITLMSTLIFIIFFIVSIFMDWNMIFNIKNFDEKMSLIIIISIAFMSINFIISLCKTILYSLQMANRVSLIEILIQIFNIIGIFILSKFTINKLLNITILFGMSTFVSNVIFSLIIFKKHKYLKPSIKKYEKRKLKSISGLGLKFFVIQIACLILFTTDNLIITQLFGPIEVTPYNTANKAFGMINSLHSAIIIPLWSSFTVAMVTNNFNCIKKNIKILNLLMIPIVLGTIILIIIFEDLSLLWIGKELNYSKELIIFIGIYYLLLIWSNIYSTVLNGMGKINIQLISAIIQAILNIPLSIYFARQCNMGVSGIILGTVIVMLIPAIALPINVYKILVNK